MDIQKIIEQIEAVTGGNLSNLSNLISDEFIKKYTNFESIEELLKNLPFNISDLNGLNSVPDEKLDQFVNDNSQFSDWKQLLMHAIESAKK